MNYETIILEMLSRIQKLEEEVRSLKNNPVSDAKVDDNTNKVSTKEIRDYILKLKEDKQIAGDIALTIIANDIHSKLNLKNRMPMVCNAMRQCMNDGDEVISETASGYSSTLQIKYYITR